MISDDNRNMLCMLFESNISSTAESIKNEFSTILNKGDLTSDAKKEQLIAVIKKIKGLSQPEVQKLITFVKEFLHDKKNMNINNFDDIKRQLKTVMAPEDLTDWTDTIKDFALYGGGVASAVTGLILMGLIFTKQKENENIY